jgi:hypothetical protein
MRRNLGSKRPLWRGLVGCIIAYAFVLNAVLSGVLGVEWAAKAAAGSLDQHCLTETGIAPAPSDQTPVEHPDDSSHCASCTVPVAPAVLPADLLSVSIVQYQLGPPAGVSDRDRPYLPGYPSRLPRGPPQQS